MVLIILDIISFCFAILLAKIFVKAGKKTLYVVGFIVSISTPPLIFLENDLTHIKYWVGEMPHLLLMVPVLCLLRAIKLVISKFSIKMSNSSTTFNFTGGPWLFHYSANFGSIFEIVTFLYGVAYFLQFVFLKTITLSQISSLTATCITGPVVGIILILSKWVAMDV